MAPRRLNLRYLIGAALLSVGAAAATFQLKHAVRSLERELDQVHAQIAQERWALQSGRADLAYLTRPERLVMQAEQLGMVPVRGSRLMMAGQLPTHDQIQLAGTPPVAATLPSGAEVSLRARPLPLLALVGLEGD